MKEEALIIKARNMLDISATYDVYDSETGNKIGALRRKGMKSIIKDEWMFLDDKDNQVGSIKEDSMAMALVRRFIIGLIPQTYFAEINGKPVCTYKQNVNPFVTKISVQFEKASEGLLDKRLGIAAGLLLCAIDGKQG